MTLLYEAADRMTWADAFERWQAARVAEDEYDEAFWTPAYCVSEAGGPAIPQAVNAEIDRLQDARLDAEEALVLTPAPNMPAVLTKIERSRKRWEDFTGWPDIWWDAVLCDLRRLGGEG